MKYGQAYKAALASEDFPPSWISAAVSYRSLKKCIKQIQTELDGLGLDPETLATLDSSFGVHKTSDGGDDKAQDAFTPELWVAVDAQTGHFLHAGLTDSSKSFLHSRASSPDLNRRPPAERRDTQNPESPPEQPPTTAIDTQAHKQVIWKQIPLTTVTNFFGALEPALTGLEAVQQNEAAKLRAQITALGQIISKATSPGPDAKNKEIKVVAKDMELWRQLFTLYTETPIFFSTHERDRGIRPYERARSQLQVFSDRLQAANIVKKFRSPASRTAFDAFATLNFDILRILRFEEMNALAVRKILKKFDKRTKLSASAAFLPSAASNLPRGINGSATKSINTSTALIHKGSTVLSHSIARDMYAEIATHVLAVVPTLDDYLCPVCAELAWKPIKLGCCNAVFCIRCIIQLQRGKDGRCPMCRSDTVMAADASRIDAETITYLKRYFPKDVEAKQAANQRAAGVDRYGPQFYRKTCVVM